MLASPATESPAMTPTASGRKIGISRVSAAKATNRPLPVIALTKSGPSPPLGAETFTAMASTIGTTARTAIPARLRRRPKMMPSSERRKRPGRVRVVAGVGRATSTSAADIEALPGQGHEDVLQARPLDSEAEHRYAVVDQVGHD